MENGDETLASAAAAAAAAAAAEKTAPNGGVAKEEEAGAAGTHVTARSYAAVAAHAEIEDLRAAKLDLEGKLAEARRENEASAEEAHRIEGIFMQAREEVTIAEFAAASAEKEAVSLRAEVERLHAALKIEKGEREVDKRRHEELARQLEAFRQEKLKLEEEIKTLQASSAATTMKEREAAPAEAPEEVEGVWQAMAVAAAVGAASTAAFVLIFLRLKR
ncbi:actin cytoskeleton-regulatory complex protein PAN1-like [Panicum virgatum]|nr:actin cytoskeleton-regulatory complex protein PAN1-like [Panicum virgatum]